MNEKQKQCFKMVYDFIHNECHNCENLMQFINSCFPESDLNEDKKDVGRNLHLFVKPYLAARRDMGMKGMKLLHLMEGD